MTVYGRRLSCRKGWSVFENCFLVSLVEMPEMNFQTRFSNIFLHCIGIAVPANTNHSGQLAERFFRFAPEKV